MRAKSSHSDGARHSQDAYLHDMLESAQFILRYMEGIDYEAFWNDSEKRDAVAMRLSVVGEAAAHVTNEPAAKLKDVPFKDIRGMRNRIVHEYGRVDYAVVWKVTQDDIAALVMALQKYLTQQPHSSSP